MTVLRITALALITLIYGPLAAICVGLTAIAVDETLRPQRPTRAA